MNFDFLLGITGLILSIVAISFMLFRNVYIIVMHKWGEFEKHSYVLGVYFTYNSAMAAGLKERYDRGCKYEPELQRFIIKM